MRTPLSPRRMLTLALAMALALPLAGCKDPQAVAAVAATGTQVADNLGTYYRSLEDDVSTIGQVETFLDTLRGIPADDGEAARLAQIEAALQQRAAMADALKAAYGDLQALLTSDAPAAASASAETLADRIGGLLKLPDGVDPAPLFGTIAEDLVRAVQAREVEKANRALGQIVSGIQQLFAREMDLYASLVEERNDDVVLLEKELLDRKMLDLQPVLQDLAALTGLTLTGNAGSAGTDVQQALAATAVVGTRAHQAASAGAARSLDTALRELAAAHVAVDQRRAPTLAQATAAVSEAAQFLDQLEQLEQEIDAASKSSATGTASTASGGASTSAAATGAADDATTDDDGGTAP